MYLYFVFEYFLPHCLTSFFQTLYYTYSRVWVVNFHSWCCNKKYQHWFVSSFLLSVSSLSRGSGCTSWDLPEDGDLPHRFYILWRLHRIQLHISHRRSLTVSTASAEHDQMAPLYSLRASADKCFYIGDISVSKRFFSLAFKGQVKGIECTIPTYAQPCTQ